MRWFTWLERWSTSKGGVIAEAKEQMPVRSPCARTHVGAFQFPPYESRHDTS